MPLIAALVVSAFLAWPQPAHAVIGTNFLCSVQADTPSDDDPISTSFSLNGLEVNVTIKVPAGVEAAQGTPDPVTGETTFTRELPLRILQPYLIDVLADDVGRAELRLKLAPRFFTGIAYGRPNLTPLLSQSFGRPADFFGNHFVVGVDVIVIGDESLAALGDGLQVEIDLGLPFDRSDGNREFMRIKAQMDSTDAEDTWPKRAEMAVAFGPDKMLMFGQFVEHHGVDTRIENQPGFDLGVEIAEQVVYPDRTTESPTVIVGTDWSVTPRTLLVGLHDQCRPWDAADPQRAHLAWITSGVPEPESADLDFDLRYGIGQGLEIVDPATGEAARTDSVVVDASIEGVPGRLDWILQRDGLSISRSPEVAPDIALDHLQLAGDDPNTDDDLPIVAAGAVEALPRHALMHARFDEEGGFEKADITLWELACRGDDPDTEPAPDDLARNDLTSLLPKFPRGCRRHALDAAGAAELRLQNFVDADAVSAAETADLRTPPDDGTQFVHVATRARHALSEDAGLYRYGARLEHLKHVVLDTAAPAEDESLIRAYALRDPVADDGDAARVVLDFDGRTSDVPADNEGSRIGADVGIADLPDELRFDYASTADYPVDATWRGDAPVEIADGEADAYLGGESAIMAEAVLETGEVDPLPTAGRVRFGDTDVDADGGTTKVQSLAYEVPGSPDDDIPAPDVPEVDGEDIARIRAGLVFSTAEQRNAGRQTRGIADLKIPTGFAAEWVRNADGDLVSVDADVCDPTADYCAETLVDLTVATQPVDALGASFDRPPLPELPADLAPHLPQPTPIARPTQGVVAALLGGGSWGIDVNAIAPARVHYDADPNLIIARFPDSAPDDRFQTTVLNVARPATGPAGIIYADGELSAIPAHLRVAIDPSSRISSDPWLWINTEDIGIDDYDDIDLDAANPPGARPEFEGTLAYGDAGAWNVAGNPNRDLAPTRTDRGADVFIRNAPDAGAVGGQVTTRFGVPRHTAVWLPQRSSCTAENPYRLGIFPCQTRNLLAMDEWTQYTVRYETTAAALGDLAVKARLDDQGTFLRAGIENIPGRLEGRVRLTQNRRLPWLGVDIDLDANEPLGTVTASFDDRLDGRFSSVYRLDENSGVPTPKYGLELLNMPAQQSISAHLRLGGESRIPWPGIGNFPPPEGEDGPGLGLFHAVLDLHDGEGVSGDETGDVDIDVAQSGLKLKARMESDGGVISAKANARIDNIELTPADIAKVFEIPILGGATGVILDRKFDLPILAEVHRQPFMQIEADTLAFKVSPHTDDLTPRPTSTRLAVSQEPLPSEPAATDPRIAWPLEGTFDYRHRGEWFFEPDYAPDRTFVTEIDASGYHDATWHNHTRCAAGADDCWLGGIAVGSSADGSRAGGTVHFLNPDYAFMLDPIFDNAVARDLNLFQWNLPVVGRVFVGAEFYARLAGQFAGFLNQFVRWPPDIFDGAQIATGQTRVEVEQFESLFVPAGDTADCVVFENKAVAGDGTQYAIEPRCSAAEDTLQEQYAGIGDETVFGFYLTAYSEWADWPLDLVGTAPATTFERWSIRLPDPVGFDNDGDNRCETESGRECYVTYKVYPREDGGVLVEMTTFYKNSANIGTRAAFIDGSGHAYTSDPDDTLVEGFVVPGMAVVDPRVQAELNGVAEIDMCDLAGACSAQPGVRYRIVFGDGVISDPITIPYTVEHEYPAGGNIGFQKSYQGMILKYRWENTQPRPTPIEPLQAIPFTVRVGGLDVDPFDPGIGIGLGPG